MSSRFTTLLGPRVRVSRESRAMLEEAICAMLRADAHLVRNHSCLESCPKPQKAHPAARWRLKQELRTLATLRCSKLACVAVSLQ